jgi:hypothetical protein
MDIRGSIALIIELPAKHKPKFIKHLNAKDTEEVGKIAVKILRLDWTEDSIISLGTLGTCVEIQGVETITEGLILLVLLWLSTPLDNRSVWPGLQRTTSLLLASTRTFQTMEWKST